MAYSFDIPGWKRQEQANRDAYHAQRGWHGPTYQMVTHHQTQEGDAAKPHGVPPGYEHPEPLGGDLLDPGGPRILPVTQQVQHGPDQSRAEAFDREAAAGMAEFYGVLGFKDRRAFGRRHRATDDIRDLDGPQEPYEVRPIDPSRYWSY